VKRETNEVESRDEKVGGWEDKKTLVSPIGSFLTFSIVNPSGGDLRMDTRLRGYDGK